MVDRRGLSGKDPTFAGNGEGPHDNVGTRSFQALRYRNWQEGARAASEALGETRTTLYPVTTKKSSFVFKPEHSASFEVTVFNVGLEVTAARLHSFAKCGN